MTGDMDQGVIYVATQSPTYVSLAFCSARSLKKFFPDLPIALFTDQTDHPLVDAGVFDTVELCIGSKSFETSWANGLYDKVTSLRRSSYRKTVFLDADTRIVSPDFIQIFDLLDSVDLAMTEALPSNSYCRQIMTRRIFNTSTLAYRATDATHDVLNQFEEEAKRQFTRGATGQVDPMPDVIDGANREDRVWLLQTDQYPLAQILTPDHIPPGLNVAVLDQTWNARGNAQSKQLAGRLKVDAKPNLKDTLVADLMNILDTSNGDEKLKSAVLAAVMRERNLRRVPGYNVPELSPDDPMVRAEVYFTVEQFKVAANLWRSQVEVAPAAVAFGLGRIARAVGELEDAIGLFRSAVEADPQFSDAIFALAETLARQEQYSKAVAVLKTIPGYKSNWQAMLAIGRYRANQGRNWRAASYYRKALALNENCHGARHELLVTDLLRRRPKGALKWAGQLLDHGVQPTQTTALKAVALFELGDRAGFEAIRNVSQIFQFDLGQDLTAGGVAALNRELAKHVESHPTLSASPAEFSTRYGYHTENLMEDIAESPAIESLAKFAASEINRVWANELERPYTSIIRFDMDAWGVVMERGGHQIPHIHPAAHWSAVYYVTVPDSVSGDDPTHAGWLAFGAFQDALHRRPERVPVHYVLPRPGLLLIFPSYFPHHTIPLNDDRRRISIAFDALEGKKG